MGAIIGNKQHLLRLFLQDARVTLKKNDDAMSWARNVGNPYITQMVSEHLGVPYQRWSNSMYD